MLTLALIIALALGVEMATTLNDVIKLLNTFPGAYVLPPAAIDQEIDTGYVNVLQYIPVGANILDGQSHPISKFFSSLSLAQAFYNTQWGSPVTSLNQQAAWAAIQTAIWAAIVSDPHLGNLGGTVMLPAGNYFTDQATDPPLMVADPRMQLNINATSKGVYGFNMIGVGGASFITVLHHGVSAPSSDPNKPALLLVDCYYCTFSNFNIVPQGWGWAGIRSVRGNQGAGGYAPSACLFQNLGLGSPDGLHWEHGVSIDGQGPGGDGNNENHIFYKVNTGGVLSGFRFQSANTHNQFMVGCSASISQYGVYGEDIAYYHWLHGNMAGNTVADFYANGQNVHVEIDGHNSENSTRLFVEPGNTGSPFYVRIQNVRWASSNLPAANALGHNEPAGCIVYMGSPGKLDIQGGVIDGPDAGPVSPLICVFYSNVNQGYVNLDAIVFGGYTPGTSALTVVSGSQAPAVKTGYCFYPGSPYSLIAS